MKCRIRTFGIASDILGGKEVTITLDGTTVADLKQQLFQQYPSLRDLNSLFIAVNHHYAVNETALSESDEIAIIPPVSGG